MKIIPLRSVAWRDYAIKDRLCGYYLSIVNDEVYAVFVTNRCLLKMGRLMGSDWLEICDRRMDKHLEYTKN